jgi:PAS domain S-box-containing protein
MNPHVAVIVTDALRRIQWVNEGFSLLTGYSFDEVVGKKPSELLQGPLTEKEAVRRIRKGLEGFLPFLEEITNYRKSGEAYRCRLAIHPIFNEKEELTNFIAFEVDADQGDPDEVPLLKMENKYRSSSLKGPDSAALYNRLREAMQKERLYLDPKLSLKKLAVHLDTNTKYLSQVVNLHFGDNLQMFINRYRIEEAKRKLLREDWSNLTLFGVAMQCGFKNKSTFYKVFKQLTGLTPMEYVKKHASSTPPSRR